MLTRRALININRAERRVLSLQEQLATGQRVNRPSDDPLAARRAVDARAEVRKNEQYLANISAARPYLQETETSLLTTTNILQRAYELTLQGANDTNSQVDRAQIAIEINQILETRWSRPITKRETGISSAVPGLPLSLTRPCGTPRVRSRPLFTTAIMKPSKRKSVLSSGFR